MASFALDGGTCEWLAPGLCHKWERAGTWTCGNYAKVIIDGAQHEIDLTAAHAAELRNQLARYVAHGRRLPGGSARRSSKAGSGRP
jgi:hypothetical protein